MDGPVKDKLDEKDRQIIHDAFMMSKPEFVEVYRLCQPWIGSEALIRSWHAIRRREKSIPREVTKTTMKMPKRKADPIAEAKDQGEPDNATPDNATPDNPISSKPRSGDKDEIMRLHNEGKGTREIKDTLGLDYRYVYGVIKRNA